MNDHQLAGMLAAQAGELLMGLRKVVTSFNDDDDELDSTLAALGREVLAKEADKGAHDFLDTQLTSMRPLDSVLSEEGDQHGLRADAIRLWIVDPLDGSSHFANGSDEFAVHIALWDSNSTNSGKLIAAAVGLPATGTVLTTADHVASELLADVLDTERPIRVLVSHSRPPAEIHRIVSALEAKFPERGVEVIPMGSAGYKVAEIISGAADIYVNTGGFYEWDIAAPMAIAAHFGLVVCDRHGNDLAFNKSDTHVPSAIVSRREFVATLVDCLV